MKDRLKILAIFILALLLFGIGLAHPQKTVDFKNTHLSADFLPYFHAPYRFKGSQMVTITFETSPEVLQALVPKPLSVNGTNQMTLAIGIQKVVEPGILNYHEAFLSIPVTYGKERGNYMPVLYLDNALAIMSGREIWGYSKLEASFQFSKKENIIQAVVIREGKTIINLSLQLGPQLGPLPPLPEQSYFNVKLIPGAENGSGPLVKQLTSSITKNRQIQKFSLGEAKLEFGFTPLDPLNRIPVKRIVKCVYSEIDFVLDYGKVEVDYLKEN